MSRKLVVDIETVGESWEKMDECTQEVLTRWAHLQAKDEDHERALLDDVKNGLGFSPLTGEIVVIGMLDVEQNKSVVYFQAPGEAFGTFEEDGVIYKQMTEGEMLRGFWEGVRQYDELITFNGRSFDVPFLTTRSAVHKIRPTKNFLANRYPTYQQKGAVHIDLQEQLTYYGAMRRPGLQLHMWCRAFGITSPKTAGVTGDDVKELFENKRYKDIARYNVRDIIATRDLYKYWNEYLRF